MPLKTGLSFAFLLITCAAIPAMAQTQNVAEKGGKRLNPGASAPQMRKLNPSSGETALPPIPQKSTKPAKPLFTKEEVEAVYKTMDQQLGAQEADRALEATTIITAAPLAPAKNLNPDRTAASQRMNMPSNRLAPQPVSLSQQTGNRKGGLFIDKYDFAQEYSELAIVSRKRNMLRQPGQYHRMGTLIVDSDLIGDAVLLERNPYQQKGGVSVKQKQQLDPIHGDAKERINGLIFVPYEGFVSEADLVAFYEAQKQNNGQLVTAVGFSNLNEGTIKELAEPYLGKPLNIETLEELSGDIKGAVRQSTQPFANIYVPEQTIYNGVIIMVIRQSVLQTATLTGNEQFTDRQILKHIRQHVGDPVYRDRLERDIAYLNLHPNREVTVAFDQGEDPNTTTMDINVREDKVWRVFASRSNDGSPTLGEHQYSGGFFHNNLWNLDHRALYQYGSSLKEDRLESHNAFYSLPVPWRNFLSVSYANSKAQSSLLNGAFSSEGTFEQWGVDYDIPLYNATFLTDGWGLEEQKLSLGIDRKISKGNVLFTLFGDPIATGIGANVLVNNFVAGYSGKLTDPYHGETTFDTAFTFSPGNWGNRNEDAAFDNARVGTKSRFWHATLAADRTMPLDLWQEDKPFTLATHFHGQITDSRLLGSERMLGGLQKGFRGYQPDSFSGDYGYGMAVDLSTPYWKITQSPLASAFQVSAFLDHGYLANVDPQAGEDENEKLLSTGLMLNLVLQDNVSTSLTLAQDLSDQDKDDVKSVLWRFIANY